MDYFQAQDQARRNTWKLLLLFLAAVASIILAVYLLLFGVLLFDAMENGQGFPDFWNAQFLGGTALGVSLLIVSGSLYKTIALSRGGGVVVAEALGGRLVSRGTQEPLEQRLLNVVDEMAIASGLPAPQVFILDNEPGINAFAAGNKPSEAVVAVTQGVLDRLSRDQLQGVVAHEFSHIFNGDMRINIRLTGLLHGILLLTMLGRTLLDSVSSSHQSSSNKKDDSSIVIVLLVLGFGLLVIGYIGVLFGQMIQAAVSRQREFLADASAVQFTRNPLGLAGALKQIVATSSKMRHPNSEAASHMFFGEGISPFSRMMATHPPIDQRILRLDPTYSPKPAEPTRVDEDTIEGRIVGDEDDIAATTDLLVANERTPMTPKQVRESIGNPEPRHTAFARQLYGDYPEAVLADLNTPTQVANLLYGMLVANTEDPATTLGMVVKDQDAILTTRVLEHAAWFNAVGHSTKLPLIELAIPALLELPPDEQARVLRNVEALVQADSQLSLFEFALTAMLHQALAKPSLTKTKRRGRYDKPAIRKDVAELLAQLARAGHDDPEAAEAAFNQAAQQAPIDQLAPYPAGTQLDLPHFDALLGRLGGLNYTFCGRLIEACVAAISADGKVIRSEAELLRAIGACLDCPVPPLLPGPESETT